MVILAQTSRQTLEDVERIAEELVIRVLKSHFHADTPPPPNVRGLPIFFVQILRDMAKKQVIVLRSAYALFTERSFFVGRTTKWTVTTFSRAR